MDDAEIRAEIERRRKRAVDLRLRETLWNLYSSQFRYIDDHLKKEPDFILTEIKESLKRLGNTSEFSFMGFHYSLCCVEGQVESDGRGLNSTDTTPMTITLAWEGNRVFEFKMTQSITYTREMPLFHESMGTVKAFTEGPWI